MLWFKNLKITKKLIVGFLIVAIIAAIVGTVGVINLLEMRKADTSLYKNEALALQYSGNAAVDLMQLRYNILKMTTLTNEKDIEATKTLIDEFRTATQDAFNGLLGLSFKDGDIIALNNEIKTGLDSYDAHIDNYLSLMGTGKKAQADDLAFNTMAPLGNELRDDFITLGQLVAGEAKDASEKNSILAQTAIIIMIIVVIIAMASSMLLGGAISRAIAGPVMKLEAVAKLLSKGDIQVEKVLTAKDLLLKQQKDEIGSLAGAFGELIETTKQQVDAIQKLADGDLTIEFSLRSEQDLLGRGLMTLVENLNGLIGTIAASSEQVSSGSSLVSHSSMALSQGATEQASSVEQLTASLQEISAQTQTNAQNAKKADELARSAKENATNGNTQMKDMLMAMEDINSSSSSINKIIKVIDDIAFQTNILALNAAVEAARAGQHGKGFAVVAEEVRTLAARSANAAKETTDLIENSINKVETGTKIANATANALGLIVEQVDKAAELVNAIAMASTEQAHGIEQISQGITQVSQVVQTNAATAEESAAASEELSAQAEQLSETIAVFKTKRGTLALGENRSELNLQSKARQLSVREGRVAGAGKIKIALNDDEFGKY